MSLYGDYIKEREGRNILENDLGFATYILNEEDCYIVDVFIDKQYRKNGIGKTFIEEISKIAKEHGCTSITTTVCPKGANSTISLKSALACGFELESSVHNLILFKKEL